jgi:hypothetical protein
MAAMINTYDFKFAHPDIIKPEGLCRVDYSVGESQALKFERLVISIQNQMMKRVQHEVVFIFNSIIPVAKRFGFRSISLLLL